MAFEVIHKARDCKSNMEALEKELESERKPGQEQLNSPFFRDFNVEVLLHLVGNPLA